MNEFFMEVSWALHEGGTKYYQVFHINNPMTRKGVVVRHYGAYTRGASRYPKEHGQKKMALHERGSGSDYRTAINAKSKRGYRDWESKNLGGSNEDVLASLRQWFDEDDTTKIAEYVGLLEALKIATPAVESEEDQAYLASLAEKSEQIEKPEIWGTW